MSTPISALSYIIPIIKGFCEGGAGDLKFFYGLSY